MSRALKFTERQFERYFSGVVTCRKDREIREELGLSIGEFRELRRQANVRGMTTVQTTAENRALQVARVRKVQEMAFRVHEANGKPIVKTVCSESGGKLSTRTETVQIPQDTKALDTITKAVQVEADLLGTKVVLDQRMVVEHVDRAKNALFRAACKVLKDYPELMQALADELEQIPTEIG